MLVVLWLLQVNIVRQTSSEPLGPSQGSLAAHALPPPTFPQHLLSPTLPRAPHGVEWVHIGKTGTSFGNTLALWACPELDPSKLWVTREGSNQLPASCLSRFRSDPASRPNWPIGDHYSLENRTDSELRGATTMLRHPAALLASHYHFIREELDRDPAHVNATARDICTWLPTSPWWQAMGHGMATKQVAGLPRVWLPAIGFHGFPWDSRPSDALRAEACRRLTLFAFVGITEFWDASVCLFHEMHGGAAHPSELMNVREGEYRAYSQAVREVECEDGSDARLYECGMWLFRHRLAAHPGCQDRLPPAARAAFQQLLNHTNACEC